jgi:hypothetical protein
VILRLLSSSWFRIASKTSWLAIIALIFLSTLHTQAQNTKGDKPANNQKSIFRIPKLKSKKKGGDKANTRDISGQRKIRTKNKSSAVRAIQTAPPRYANRKPSGDHAYRPRGGPKLKLKSRTADASRNNVYPNYGPFISNPSPRPKDNQHAYSNQRNVSRAASMGTKREPPGRKRIITPRSASRSFVTWGRKNVYWGKFRKGERPITTDISGRPLRAKNFHTPGLGVLPAGEIYKKRKKYGDQPYKGTFKNGYVTTPKTTRAWRGDVSGHAIRTKPPKLTQNAGHYFQPRKLSISNQRRGLSRPLPGSGLASRPSDGRISNSRVPGKAPGLGANLLERALGKFRGKKRTTRGNLSASKGFNSSQPIGRKAPGVGARFIDQYQGFIKGGIKAFSTDGYGFSGSLKSRRALKGGGSISGRGRNNGGLPITVKGPGIGGRFVDTYQGNLKGRKAFATDGYGFSGSIKARRTLKGGGSISGRARNNGGQPIDVKGPGIGGRFVDTYQGNLKGRKIFTTDGYDFSGTLKTRRAPKGGGSISGRARDNGGRPIDVRGPGIGGRFVDTYRGNIRFWREPKGGGSISGHWNNKGQPIIVKAPAGGAAKYIDTYQGFFKGQKPLKGGGSVSGKLWNNSNSPILVTAPAGAQAKYIDTYKGFFKAQKPLKGGGSVSGKLWNNNETPIEGKAYAPVSRKIAAFTGDKKQLRYVHNHNAKKEALKVVKPNKSNALVSNLQIKTKPREYDRNKLSSKAALKGESNGKNSVKAIEYGSRMKQLWVKTFGDEKDLSGRILRKKYVHNPNSKKGALMVMAPGRAYARLKDFQINVKMTKPHGNNLHPDSKFAHSIRNNVKHERTFLMAVKLKWAKLFKKNDTQPAAVKQKVRRPRYDPKERDLWKDLYD